MILYLEFNNSNGTTKDVVLFVIPETNIDVRSTINGYGRLLTLCHKAVLYNICEGISYNIKDRYTSFVYRDWIVSDISDVLTSNFLLGTLHNGEIFSYAGYSSNFRVIEVDINSTENIIEYLETMNEIYRFF